MPVTSTTPLGSPLTPSGAPGPLAAAPAARLRRPSWRDTRLVVGVLLVLLSTAAGARIMAAADDTVGVWAASRTLPAGAALTDDALVVQRVRLPSGGNRYLEASALPAPGSVLLRPVGAGELVPRAALGKAADLKVRPVAIPLKGPVPSGLQAGGKVDVWVAARTGNAEAARYGTPELMVEAADVGGLKQDKGAFGGGERSVEVLVPTGSLSRLLAAMANGASLTLTPLPGAGEP